VRGDEREAPRIVEDFRWLSALLEHAFGPWLWIGAILLLAIGSRTCLGWSRRTSKVIVVATEGENNAGRAPKDGAEVARENGVRVH